MCSAYNNRKILNNNFFTKSTCSLAIFSFNIPISTDFTSIFNIFHRNDDDVMLCTPEYSVIFSWHGTLLDFFFPDHRLIYYHPSYTRQGTLYNNLRSIIFTFTNNRNSECTESETFKHNTIIIKTLNQWFSTGGKFLYCTREI